MDAIQQNPIAALLFLALVLALVTAEALWLRRARGRTTDWSAVAASFGIAIGKKLTDIVTAGAVAGLFLLAWDQRFWSVEMTGAGAWLLLFLLVELVYYWHHRCAHEIRWLWATHAVHHSAEEMNLAAAIRLGWTSLLSGSALFFAPLCLLGFPPAAVLAMLAVNLLYQLWIHTEAVGRLPRAAEWLLNTPSHHRVHHGSNPQYLDRNYGGVLILWDRVFGTWEPEGERVRYGLTEPVESRNPAVIALHEWGRMARDLRGANSWREALGFMFGPPGWKPDAPRRFSKLVLRNPFR